MIFLQCSVKTKAMRIYSRGIGFGEQSGGKDSFCLKKLLWFPEEGTVKLELKVYRESWSDMGV